MGNIDELRRKVELYKAAALNHPHPGDPPADRESEAWRKWEVAVTAAQRAELNLKNAQQELSEAEAE